MDKIFQQDLTKEEKVDGIFIVKLNLMVNHAYNTALYLLINDNPIETGDTIGSIPDGSAQLERWVCRYEESLIQPVREVLDIDTGAYAAGNRHYK